MLSDVSPSSVSFITSDRCRPGLEVDIAFDAGEQRGRRYRVTRTSWFDQNLSLVACRLVRSAG